MFTKENYKTKQALKDAVASGDVVVYHQPTMDTWVKNGITFVGDQSHNSIKWYAQCYVENGVIVSVS